MIYITGQEIKELLDMKSCISLMAETLTLLSKGDAKQTLRTAMKLEGRNILGVMPAAITSKNIAGTKVITIFPDNFQKQLPSHQGEVLVFETSTGSLKAVVEGEAITGIRTAAVSAVATDLLSRKNSSVLGMLGSGLQARKHLEAILLVRDIREVHVWDVNQESAECYAKEMSDQFHIAVTARETAKEAVQNADIICTVTAAKEPVLQGKYVKKGAHINAVGSCTPDCRELDTDVIKKSKLFVDRRESTVNEAGDYIIPLKEGAITDNHIIGELGDLIPGMIKGREHDEEVTVFEALGLAVEDLAAADYIINKYHEKMTKEDRG